MSGRSEAACNKPHNAPSLHVYGNVVTTAQAPTRGGNVRDSVQLGNNNRSNEMKPPGVGAGKHYS